MTPEEALKKISPTYAMTGGLQVEIATKDVKQELTLEEAPVKSPVTPIKKGRKANV